MKKKTIILISSFGTGTILLLLLLIILLPHIRNRFNGPYGLVFAKSPDKESYIVVGIKDDSITDIVIPDTFKNKPVTGIGNSESTNYELNAFNVTYLSNGITTYIKIPDLGFGDCTKLTSITLPNTLKYIGAGAFSHCSSLTDINIPDRVTSIGDSAFYGCSSLTSITLPKKLKKIGKYVFDGCTSLTSLTIPDSVKSIGNLSFCQCENLTSFTIPENVKCGVTTIDSLAFSDCKVLTHITIPDGITEIGEFAFADCENLTSVTIPSSVKRIGKGGSPLTTIYYRGTHDEWDILEDEIDGFNRIYYPNLETLHCTDGVYTFS